MWLEIATIDYVTFPVCYFNVSQFCKTNMSTSLFCRFSNSNSQSCQRFHVLVQTTNNWYSIFTVVAIFSVHSRKRVKMICLCGIVSGIGVLPSCQDDAILHAHVVSFVRPKYRLPKCSDSPDESITSIEGRGDAISRVRYFPAGDMGDSARLNSISTAA